MSIINKRFSKSYVQQHIIYGLLCRGFITGVEMYSILAASKMHGLFMNHLYLEVTANTNMFVLSVSDFKKAFREQNVLINLN